MFAADGNMELIFDVREEVYTSSLEKGNEIDDKSVLIYPNPCSGDTRMEFITKIAGRSSLLLFGPTGKLISQKKAYLQPGAHVFSIAMNHAGIHFLKLVTPTFGFGQSVLSLGNSEGGTGIQYSSYNGERAYARGYHRKGSTKAEVKNAIPAAKGDLLRFSAYSGSRMEMLYDFLMSDSIYAFTFPEVPPGVYLRVNDSLASDLDTVHCFVSRGGVYFSTLGRDSGVFERGRLPLRPVTFGGLRKPEYRWEFKHQEIWFMDTVSNLSGDLVPKAFKEDTTTLTLHDHSNSFSKAFVMIMVPDDFVAKGVALSTIKQENTLNEISGMAASVKNPDCFWVHNDSGDEARLYLINTDGSIVSTVNLVTDHTDNRDWEDIAVGPGPVEGETYIYIGEIGDLDRKYSDKYIFRIVEPEIDLNGENKSLRIPSAKISTITFDYSDGSRDAEILMIDPTTRDLYIITKREESVQIYPLSYPQNVEEKILLSKSSITLPFRLTNGGDISADGKEILIKNLSTVYYWKRKEEESVLEALSRPGESLPYTKEPQGEAIAWFRDGSAYVTVSEKKDGITPVIYLYKRRW